MNEFLTDAEFLRAARDNAKKVGVRPPASIPPREMGRPICAGPAGDFFDDIFRDLYFGDGSDNTPVNF